MAESETKPIASSNTNLMSEVYIGSAENTFFKSPMVQDSYMAPYNPDDLWQKSGDYSIYEDMLQDEQVSICLQLKKDLVLGSGFDIVPQDENQEEIVENLKDLLSKSDFFDSLEEILSAYEFGFSLTEKVFSTSENGFLNLKDLKTRHPNSWLIYQDDKGNITKYEQNTSQGDIEVDPKSLIHYINNKKFQNPYGTSDLRSCYAAWFAKRQVIRYFAIYLEKAASPIPVARYDKAAPKGTATDLLDVLKRFQTKTAIVLPKDVEVEFLEAKSTGDAYSKAIDVFNLFIGRSLFIPDLLGLSGSETGGGSFSLGKEQIKIFFMHINRRRAALEKIINEHIVWPIVLYNFGNIENYPKFKFKPLDDDHALDLGKVWLDAVKGKVFKANEDEINYFRELVKFPQGEVEYIAEPSLFPSFNKDNNQKEQQQEQEKKEQSSEDQKPKEDQKENKEELEKQKEEESNQLSYASLPGDYSKKVNFKQIKSKLDDYDNSIMNEAQPIVKKILSDLMDQIEKKKILQDNKFERIESLNLKYLKELKIILKNSFLQLFKDSQIQAASELDKSNFADPLPSDEFLALLESETFDYIGDWKYNILKKARIDLIAAIKDGKSISQIEGILRDDLTQLSKVSLERYARTKHTEVMNKARRAYFDESEVIAAYQYSAILDDVTTEICRSLDGKIFTKDNAPNPPLHFNCRSLLVPITKYEKFKPTESIKGMSPDEFIEENIGKGFSKFSKDKKEEQINLNDPEVSYVMTESGNEQIYVYSKKGKEFYKITLGFEDETRQKQISMKRERIEIQSE